MNTPQSIEFLALNELLMALPAEDPRREIAYRRIDALLALPAANPQQCPHEATLVLPDGSRQCYSCKTVWPADA